MIYLFESYENKNSNKATYYTRNFATYANALAYMEKLKIAKPDVNINMYYDPTDTINSNLCVNGKYYEKGTFDITWNTQMECYPDYPVYTADGFKQKKAALKEYHHKMTKVWKNWNEDYDFDTYLKEETKNEQYLNV